MSGLSASGNEDSPASQCQDASPGVVRQARLIGVGVGPGDPELLTLKAVRAIREADVVFAPVRRSGGQSMALEIVGDLLDSERQQVIVVPFPESRDGESWEPATREIVAALSDWRRGVFLTEGDPTLFGSFGHVAEVIRRLRPDLEIETVPGVSSVAAAAAAAGIALTDYDERLAVMPASAGLDGIEQALADFECTVVLKVGSALAEILDLLERCSLSDSATYVRRCGWPDQQIVYDVQTLRRDPPRDYFALLIVRRA